MVSNATPIRIRTPALHAGQQEVRGQAQRFNVLRCGRRWGKSEFGLGLMLDTILTPRPAGWFAPTYKILAPTWDDAQERFAPIIIDRDAKLMSLRFIGGGKLDFWSLENRDSGRGRKYARVVIDEAASVAGLKDIWEQTIRPTLADYRGDAWFLSTPKPLVECPGASGLYYDELYRYGGIRPRWMAWQRPTVENPYISPAEVEEARRDLPPPVFAQEFLGIPMTDSQCSFFRAEMLRQVREQHCRPPLTRGELLFTVNTLAEGTHYAMTAPTWADGHTLQRVRLWRPLTDGRPRQDRAYVAFADLSQGVGASNSTLGFADVDTREQVATFTTPDLTPDQFARYAVAVCRWVGGQRAALLGWEANGPGQVFGREVARLGYGSVMRNRDLRQTSDFHGELSQGWWSTRDSKAVLLSDLRRALVLGEFIPREAEMLDEAAGYVYYPSGAIGPAGMIEELEGARKAHGDRVIRDGGLVMMLREASKAEPPPPEPPPANSYAGMMAREQARERKMSTW